MERHVKCRSTLICFYLLVQLTNCAAELSFDEKLLTSEVRSFSNKLKLYSDYHLGVSYLQEHFDTITVKGDRINGKEIVNAFQERLSKKIMDTREALKPIKDFIVNNYDSSAGEKRTIQSCCTYDTDLSFDNLFSGEVNYEDICEYGPTKCSSSQSVNTLHLLNKQSATKMFKKSFIKHGKASSRHIYYGDKDGYFIAYPAQYTGRELCQCKAFDPRFRPWYIDSINTNVGKEIIFLIDFSSKMAKLENYLKMFANHLIGVVDTRDKIYLKILKGGNDKTHERIPCMKQLTDAHLFVTEEMKSIFEKTSFEGSKTSSFFEDAFGKFNDSKREKVLILVTSGDYSDTTQVRTQFLQGVKRWNCSISVNIFLLSADRGTSLQNYNFHKELIEAICKQCQTCNEGRNHFFDVNNIKRDETSKVEIRNTIAKLYDSFYASMLVDTTEDIHFVMPYEDYYGLGTMIDACIRVSKDRKFLGVLCMSYLQDELFGVTTDFTESEHQYRFLMDASGTTFIHPYYVSPALLENAIRFDLTTFETSERFKDVYNSMKRGESNSTQITTNVSVPKGLNGAAFEEKNYSYYWHKVLNSPFSIGVVISDEYIEQLEFPQSSYSDVMDVYHNLESDINVKTLCRVGNTVATKQSSAIKLPNSVFKQQTNKDSKENVKKLMDYFNGVSMENLDHIESDEIARQLKRSVLATRFMNAFWLNDPELTVYKRYIGMVNGVFRIYPGQQISPNFDPTETSWYKIAQTHTSNELSFIPPFMDGSKKLVTLSCPIKKKKNNLDQLAGVMGMDFELSYFKGLLDSFTLSSDNESVLISEDGFIIFHPDFIKKEINRNVHIIEKVPSIASSMIDRNIMEKNYCIEYNNAAPKIIWFYNVNRVKTVEEIKTDCMHYWVASIPYTNLLLLTIKKNECPRNSNCICSRSNVQGDLPECQSGENTCDCGPCFLKKVCLSELPRNESLICRPQRLPSKISSVIHDTDKMEECFPKHCNIYKDKTGCERIGCEYSQGKCIEASALTSIATPPTNERESSCSTGRDIGIGIAITVVPIIILIVAMLVWKYRTINGAQVNKRQKIGFHENAVEIDAVEKPTKTPDYIDV